MYNSQNNIYCYFCGKEMIWEGSSDCEEIGIPNDGIVERFICPQRQSCTYCIKENEE